MSDKTNCTFNFESFEITLIKQQDCVTIRCLDNRLFKTYQESFSNAMIDQICAVDTENFYKICKTCLEVLQKYGSGVDNEKAMVTFLCKEQSVCLKMVHKLYLKFEFDLILPLTEHVKMSGQDLCIKKLENELANLRLFIENHMEVCVMDEKYTFLPGGSFHALHKLTMPINTEVIKLEFCERTNHDTIIYLRPSKNERFNAKFKIIKCKILEIKDGNHNFGYENLPETIEEIKLTSFGDPHITIFLENIKKRNLPNLHTLNFCNCTCSAMTNVYDLFVVPLQLKTIKVSNCSNFNGQHILESHKINCITY